MSARPPAAVVGLPLLAVVVVYALLHGDALLAAPSTGLRIALLVVPLVVTVLNFVVTHGTPVDRAPWWRLIRHAYLLITLMAVVRDLPVVPGGRATDAVAQTLGALGALLTVAALVVWHRGSARSGVSERAVDVVLLALAILTAVWCLLLRPRLDGRVPAGAHGATGVLDRLVGGAQGLKGMPADGAVAAGAGIVVRAMVLAAAISGALRGPAGYWGTLAGVAAVAGDLVALARPAGRAPLLAHLLWVVAAVSLACVAVEIVRTGPPGRSDSSRWRPHLTAFACAVPVAVYAGEAVMSGADGASHVRDARVLGLVLLVMAAATVWRVTSAVLRATQLRTRLAHSALSDHLTGLANRRTADEVLERAVDRARRGEASVAVALVDVDHFKEYNDRYGHHAGDELLVDAANRWTGCLGTDQLVARYGGEEFLLVATAQPLVDLTDTIDRMRRVMPHGQSFSAGVASWVQGEDAGLLVARADAALYEAKAQGRGRTSMAYSADAYPELRYRTPATVPRGGAEPDDVDVTDLVGAHLPGAHLGGPRLAGSGARPRWRR